MPDRYLGRRAPLERTRCLIARVLLKRALLQIRLVALILPTTHPVRIYLNGRVPQIADLIQDATIPAGEGKTDWRGFRRWAKSTAWELAVITANALPGLPTFLPAVFPTL